MIYFKWIFFYAPFSIAVLWGAFFCAQVLALIRNAVISIRARCTVSQCPHLFSLGTFG
nr:MAG TPA: hypothetical protein [Caudoviricetes sp.]